MKEIWLNISDISSRDIIIAGLAKSGYSVRCQEEGTCFWLIIKVPENNIMIGPEKIIKDVIIWVAENINTDCLDIHDVDEVDRIYLRYIKENSLGGVK